MKTISTSASSMILTKDSILLSSLDPLAFINKSLSGKFKQGWLRLDAGSKPVLISASSSSPYFQEFKTLTVEEVMMFAYSINPGFSFYTEPAGSSFVTTVSSALGELDFAVQVIQSYDSYLKKITIPDGLTFNINFHKKGHL